jgi:hypothetical protein
VVNNLCVCAPGYKFIAKDKPCGNFRDEYIYIYRVFLIFIELIKPVWINSVLEYGVCTRITSEDKAIDVPGTCPLSLKCEAREDKHVCSCGKNQFLDLDDPTKCGKNRYIRI